MGEAKRRRNDVEAAQVREIERLKRLDAQDKVLQEMFSVKDTQLINRQHALSGCVKMNEILNEYKKVLKEQQDFNAFIMRELFYADPTHVVFDKVPEDIIAQLRLHNIERHGRGGIMLEQVLGQVPAVKLGDINNVLNKEVADEEQEAA
jgi:hypothetical protein